MEGTEVAMEVVETGEGSEAAARADEAVGLEAMAAVAARVPAARAVADDLVVAQRVAMKAVLAGAAWAAAMKRWRQRWWWG